ncbi:MAG: diguanylate cyclase domain-containing protein [Spirochaetaceae bacterium]
MKEPVDLLRKYRAVHGQYKKDLLSFSTKTNLFRFQIFSFLLLFVSSIAVFFTLPQTPLMKTLFLLLTGASLLFFIAASLLRRRGERPLFTLSVWFIHGGVLFFMTWATVQVFCAEGDIRSYITYVGFLLAVAAVFSVRPLYYFALAVLSFASFFIAPKFLGVPALLEASRYFPFLFTSVLFGWVISLMHYLTVIEIFFMKKQVEEGEKKAELALTGGNLGYWNWDIRNETIEVDGRWVSMLGYEALMQKIKFDEFFRMIVPEDRRRVAESVHSYFDGKSDKYGITFRMHTKDGGEKWIYTEGSITSRDKEGKPLFMHGIHQDVQELREQQKKLQESELQFRAYTENAPVGVFIVQGLFFTYVNPEAIRITGYAEEELLSSVNLFTLTHPEERGSLKQDIRELLKSREGKGSYLYRIVSKTGDIHWFETRLSTVNWKKQMFLLSAIDVTERIQAEEKLKEHATYDELTGVFNRRVGLTLLEKEMHRTHREGGSFTLCFIDINGLKIVNDTLGHEEGDALIKKVVGVVEKMLRSGDIFCRLGGDEFLLIFRDCGMDSAKKIKVRIEEHFHELNSLKENSYEVSVSYGLLEYGRDSSLSVDELVHRADQHMYEDKLQRKAQRGSRPSLA